MTTICTLFAHFAHCFFMQCIWPLCRAKSSSLNIFNLILYCGRSNDLYEMPNTKRKHKASGSQSIAADTDTSIQIQLQQIQLQTAIDTFASDYIELCITDVQYIDCTRALMRAQYISLYVYMHVYICRCASLCVYVCVYCRTFAANNNFKNELFGCLSEIFCSQLILI